MKTKIWAAASVMLFTILGFVGLAAAQGAVAPPSENGSLYDLVQMILSTDGWWAKGAIALVLAVGLAKRYAPGKIGEFVNGRGAPIFVLLAAFGGALAASLTGVSSVPMSAALAVDALKVAFVASGGYTLIRALLENFLLETEWYATRAPAWLRAALSIVLWMFERKSDGGRVIEQAERDGQAAVDKDPPKGADGAAGPTASL